MQTRIEELLQRRNEMLEQDLGEGGGGDSGVDYEARIAEAHRGMCATRKKFQRLRTVCISAEQGLKGMLARAQVALQEITAAELTPASNIPQGTPPRPGKKLERRERCALHYCAARCAAPELCVTLRARAARCTARARTAESRGAQ